MSAMSDPKPPERFDEEFLAWLEERTRAGGFTWTGGYREADLLAIEAHEGLPFPPDYRLFLATLGASTGEPRFYDWRTDLEAIHAARSAVVDGILHDVDNGIWLSAWGPRPTTIDQRRRTIAANIQAAPRLLPIVGHRYLVAEPCRPGNPVLSIVGTDAIVYGADLRAFLLAELRLGSEALAAGAKPEDVRDDLAAVAGIDFWGALVIGDTPG
jgi:hypothetical protein